MMQSSDGDAPGASTEDAQAANGTGASGQGATTAGNLGADHEEIRLAGVTIAWNAFQHFYPYFDVLAVDWDRELSRALEAAIADSTEEDFFDTLSLMLAALDDGHARVFHRLDEEKAWLPIEVSWIEDQLVVTSTSDPITFSPGDVVLGIDGVDAVTALLQAERFLSGSPQRRRHVALMRFGYGDAGTAAALSIARNGETRSVEVHRNYYRDQKPPGGPAVFELEEGIYYVDLTRATMRRIGLRMDELVTATGVIFDLRGEPKGNHEIIGHLLEDDVTLGTWRTIPRTIYPDRESAAGFEDVGWSIVPRRPRIEGKVVFITDASTISYAEFVMSYVEHFRLGEIVGQPTAGANGSINALELPGGFGITWTGVKVVKFDGSRHHGTGTRPTVPVERTIAAVKEGRDEFLEEALELVKRRP
jgi:C-terminal processing protease CtpA/Prc